MHLPGSLDAQSFLDRYWQKAPLCLPAFAPADLPVLDGDELGWLATQDDVESRLVFTERGRRGTRYRVRFGPFDADELRSLPERDWTLLVQDVDKHLPDFRRWFELCSFIPDWRLDDLMMSFAAPGGGVGPHVDNYDVFLVQGAGQREWRRAEPGSVRPARRAGPLALMHEFTDPEPFFARPGDGLYLPPGVPHWGIACDACTTLSIGFRAPTRADLLGALRQAGCTSAPPPSAADARRFYRDPGLAAGESAPGLVSRAAIRRVGELLGPEPAFDEQAIACALGTVVTSTKEWLTPEPLDRGETEAALAALSQGQAVELHGMARLAYARVAGGRGERCWLFVNGRCREISAYQADLVAQLGRQRALQRTAAISDAGRDADLADLGIWLAAAGAIEPPGTTSGPDA